MQYKIDPAAQLFNQLIFPSQCTRNSPRKRMLACQRQLQRPAQCGGATPSQPGIGILKLHAPHVAFVLDDPRHLRRWYSFLPPKILEKLAEKTQPCQTNSGRDHESPLLDLTGPPRSAHLRRWFDDDTFAILRVGRTVFALHRVLHVLHSSDCLLRLTATSASKAPGCVLGCHQGGGEGRGQSCTRKFTRANPTNASLQLLLEGCQHGKVSQRLFAAAAFINQALELSSVALTGFNSSLSLGFAVTLLCILASKRWFLAKFVAKALAPRRS